MVELNREGAIVKKFAKPYKIILADVPRLREPLREFPHPNMGILYLNSYAKGIFGNAIEIFYLEAFLSLDEHIKRVKKIQPDLYGISFLSLYKREALATVKMIKAQFPDLFIVAGGTHPTTRPEECLGAGIDLVVLGEGEVTFSEVIKKYCFQGDKGFDDVDGVAYYRNGDVHRTEKRKLIEDLDTIPLPDWNICTEAKYTGLPKVKKLPYGTVVISRGCPFDCNFCSNPVWKHNTPRVRLRNPANIASEIEFLYKRGYREIELICDEFNSSLSWAKDVCKAIVRLNLKDMYFNTIIRARPIDDEFCRLLKDINCWSVSIGIESANERVLEGIGKGVGISDIINACRLLQKNNIRVLGFFMMFNIWEKDNSVCFETKEEVYNTLGFAKKLLRQKLINNISWGFVSPVPGSRLYKTCVKHKLIDEEAYLTSKYDKTTVPIPDISSKELMKLKRYGYLMQAFYTFKNELPLLNLKNYMHIVKRVKYLVK